MKRRHLLILVPLLLIGLAGCSSGSGGADAEANKAAGLKYAQCMRENGMPDFPDPDSDGRIRFESGKTPDPDSPELKAADEKCKHNMPGGGGGVVVGPEKDK